MLVLGYFMSKNIVMNDLFQGSIFLATAILVTIFAGLLQGQRTANHFQLKADAQKDDKKSKTAYALYSYGTRLSVTLGLLWALSVALLSALVYEAVGVVLFFVLASICIFITSFILPNYVLNKYYLHLTAWSAPVLRKIIGPLAFITKPLSLMLDRISPKKLGHRVYLKEELIDLFSHTESAQGALLRDELSMIRSMLEFGDKKIRDVMTPRRMVSVVSRDDEVGPLLMDELHRSGHSRFPVIAEPKQFTFVGTLYLRDLVGQKSLKKVKELMSSDVRYVHEEESLAHALQAFLKTHHHLFVVVNSFEEFVGVLSIEDVLEEIIGREIIDEFDQHDDLRAVAASIAQKEKAAREKQVIKSKK